MSEQSISSDLSISLEDFKEIVDGLPRLVMLVDRNGKIAYWNAGGTQIFGYTVEESIGKPVWFLYPNRDSDDFREDLKHLEKGEVVTTELEGRHKNGSTIWIDSKRKLVKLKSGRTFVLASACDISVQVKAEHDLASNQTRIESILETAVEGIVTIDKNGIIRSFNHAAEEMFGYKSREVIGESVNMLMPTPYNEEHDEYIRNYLRTGESKIIGIGREVRGRSKDGTVFPMELSVSEVRLSGEIYFTGFIRDISERRQLENEILKISEEERRRIGRDLHDGLGQMLTGIGLISQNLARKLKANGLPGAEEVEEIYEMIREADEEAKALARGLVNIELEADSFSEAVKHLCSRSKRLFKIECEMNLEMDEMIEIKNEMSKLHLYRIIQEAVNNAVRHGKATKVEVSIYRKEDYLRLIVTDNGVGFSESMNREKAKGMGMKTMNYRAHMLGGNLNVRESEDGKTMIVCTIPDIDFNEKLKQP